MIGLGGFSKVFLGILIYYFIKARHLVNQKFYALKVIDKKFILDNNKEDIVLNERHIMIHVNHPFIVKLEFAF
jgi:serum/glucocorticoid-regulated kinase 2